MNLVTRDRSFRHVLPGYQVRYDTQFLVASRLNIGLPAQKVRSAPLDASPGDKPSFDVLLNAPKTPKLGEGRCPTEAYAPKYRDEGSE